MLQLLLYPPSLSQSAEQVKGSDSNLYRLFHCTCKTYWANLMCNLLFQLFYLSHHVCKVEMKYSFSTEGCYNEDTHLQTCYITNHLLCTSRHKWQPISNGDFESAHFSAQAIGISHTDSKWQHLQSRRGWGKRTVLEVQGSPPETSSIPTHTADTVPESNPAAKTTPWSAGERWGLHLSGKR